MAAAQAMSYFAVVERDTLSTGGTIYVASNPELPGCKGQGTTPYLALRDLDDARSDYIDSLTEDGLPVPEPQNEASATLYMNCGP